VSPQQGLRVLAFAYMKTLASIRHWTDLCLQALWSGCTKNFLSLTDLDPAN